MARLLRQRLQTHMAENNATLHDMIRELKKIKFFKTKRGKWVAKNSLTKIQKELIAALNLEFLKEERLAPRRKTCPPPSSTPQSQEESIASYTLWPANSVKEHRTS